MAELTNESLCRVVTIGFETQAKKCHQRNKLPGVYFGEHEGVPCLPKLSEILGMQDRPDHPDCCNHHHLGGCQAGPACSAGPGQSFCTVVENLQPGKKKSSVFQATHLFDENFRRKCLKSPKIVTSQAFLLYRSFRPLCDWTYKN